MPRHQTLVHPTPNSSFSYNSRSSTSSKSSASIHSETSSSRDSDYIFGSDNYGDFGSFPTAAAPSYIKKEVVIVPPRRREGCQLETLPVLQKSAMSAFLASPSPNRWSDLVRTMRVESRIKEWKFASLHDDIDKMVDDCNRRQEENDAYGCHFATIDLTKTTSKETDMTQSSTSSSSRSGSPDSNLSSDESSPSDESFTFCADFSNAEYGEAGNVDENVVASTDIPKEQAKMPWQVRLAMLQFMSDPSSQNAWSQLVESFREEKMRQTGVEEEYVGEVNAVTEDIYGEEDENEKGWANFDDVSIDNEQNVIVEHDIKFQLQQKCAMDAFLLQPSQDKWIDLVQSIREEKMRQPVTCSSLSRLQSKLEKLEEEASAAETESWDGVGSDVLLATPSVDGGWPSFGAFNRETAEVNVNDSQG
jgi:hypothetical protein